MNFAVWENNFRLLQEKKEKEKNKNKNKNKNNQEGEEAAEEETVEDPEEEGTGAPEEEETTAEVPDDAVKENVDDASDASETIDNENPPEEEKEVMSNDDPEEEEKDTTEIEDTTDANTDEEEPPAEEKATDSSSDVTMEENLASGVDPQVQFPVDIGRNEDGTAVAYSCRSAMPSLKDDRLQEDPTLIPTKVQVEYDFDVLHKPTLATSSFYESLDRVEERILIDVAASLGLTVDCVDFVLPQLNDTQAWETFVAERSTRIVTVRSQPQDIVDTGADCIVDRKKIQLESYVGVEAAALDCTSIVGYMTLKYVFGSDETGIKNNVLSRIKEGMERNKYISAEFPHLAYVGSRPETGGKDEVFTIDTEREDPGALLAEGSNNPEEEQGNRWTGIGISLLFFLLLCFVVLSFVLVRRVRSGRRLLDGKPRSPRHSRAAAQSTAGAEGDDEALTAIGGYQTDGDEEDSAEVRADDVTDYEPIRGPVASTDETPPRSNTSASIAAETSPDAFNEDGSQQEDHEKKFTRTARAKRAMAGAMTGAVAGATAAVAMAATGVASLRKNKPKDGQNAESAPETTPNPRTSTVSGEAYTEVGEETVTEDGERAAEPHDGAGDDKRRGVGTSTFFAGMMQPRRNLRKGKTSENNDPPALADIETDDENKENAENNDVEDFVNAVETPTNTDHKNDFHEGITPARSGIRSEVYESPDAVEIGLQTTAEGVEDSLCRKDTAAKKEVTGADVILSELEEEEALGRSRYVLGRETSDLSKQQRERCGRDIMKDRLKIAATSSTEETEEVEMNFSPSGF